MTYTRDQLIDALSAEYAHLCQDDYDPDIDPTPDDYRAMLLSLSDDESLAETSTDDVFTLDDFMHAYT